MLRSTVEPARQVEDRAKELLCETLKHSALSGFTLQLRVDQHCGLWQMNFSDCGKQSFAAFGRSRSHRGKESLATIHEDSESGRGKEFLKVSVLPRARKRETAFCSLPSRSSLSCFALPPSRAGDQHSGLWQRPRIWAEACRTLALFLSSLDLSCFASARSRRSWCAAGACTFFLHASRSK